MRPMPMSLIMPRSKGSDIHPTILKANIAVSAVKSSASAQAVVINKGPSTSKKMAFIPFANHLYGC